MHKSVLEKESYQDLSESHEKKVLFSGMECNTELKAQFL